MYDFIAVFGSCGIVALLLVYILTKLDKYISKVVYGK